MATVTPVQKVRWTSAKVKAALARRDEAIREAHIKGMSLRNIAEAADMSHEKVRTILWTEKQKAMKELNQ